MDAKGVLVRIRIMVWPDGAWIMHQGPGDRESNQGPIHQDPEGPICPTHTSVPYPKPPMFINISIQQPIIRLLKAEIMIPLKFQVDFINIAWLHDNTCN